MFSRNASWICMDERPLIAVGKGTTIFSSGCGTHAVRSRRGKQVSVRDKTRYTHYRAGNCSVLPDEVRVPLLHRGQPSGAHMLLSRSAAGCVIRVEGLPWDHNHVVFHLALQAQERLFPHGDLYRVATEAAILWADVDKPYPVMGCHTGDGLALSVSPAVFAQFRPTQPNPEWGSARLEVRGWHAQAELRLSQHPSAAAACDALRRAHAMHQELPNPTQAMPSILAAQGGETAVLEQIGVLASHADGAHADGTQTDGTRADGTQAEGPEGTPADVAAVPLHVALVDWQGMRHTLAGGMMDCAWEPDRTGYPHLSQLITDLRAMQVVSVLPVLPLVDMDSELFGRRLCGGIAWWGPRACLGGSAQGKTAAWLDLSRPQTVEWIAGQLRELLDKTSAKR
jgi:hypothetical protein